MRLILSLLFCASLVSSRLYNSYTDNGDLIPCWYGTMDTFYRCFRLPQCPRHCTESAMRRCERINIYQYWAMLGPEYGVPIGFDNDPVERVLPRL